MSASPLPQVSVALCVHNGARFLAAQLDSILAQRDVTLEVVAVDDASTDASLALLEDYARRDGRIRVHRNPATLGITRSFERAMSLCTAPFLAPSDQDDVWAPDKLATLLAAIGPADLAYGDSAYIDEAGQPSGRRISDDLDMLHGREPLKFAFANSVSGHALLVRRSLFEEARPLPAELYYDWVLALFAAARGGVVYVERPLVQFRRHTQACSSLGKACAPREADRYRAWLRDRAALLALLAHSRFDAQGRAGRLSHALEQARHGRSPWPLLRAIWNERRALALPAHSPWRTALRLQLRMLRKLARAAQEAARHSPA